MSPFWHYLRFGVIFYYRKSMIPMLILGSLFFNRDHVDIPGLVLKSDGLKMSVFTTSVHHTDVPGIVDMLLGVFCSKTFVSRVWAR